MPTDSVQAPVEIFSFIEKQEDYIEQLEKESKYCRSELTNLLGKVKDVINENEHLTENARTELAALGGGTAKPPPQALQTTTSPSSDSDEHLLYAGRKTPTTPRKSNLKPQSPRYASAPNIVYEARISELEAELMQANIDLKRVKTENEELKRKLAHTDPLSAVATLGSVNCETHRKQLELLQQDKTALEESVRQLQRMLDEAKSQHHNSASSKRYITDLVQMERSQAEVSALETVHGLNLSLLAARRHKSSDQSHLPSLKFPDCSSRCATYETSWTGSMSACGNCSMRWLAAWQRSGPVRNGVIIARWISWAAI